MPLSREFIKNHKVEVLALLCLCTAFGFHGTSFNAIPYMFFRPEILCKSSDIVAQEYVCSEETMCNIIQGNNPEGLSYRLNSYNDINSIVIEYDLFCGLRYYEALIQTILTIGQLGGYLLSFMWNIPPKLKYRVVLITMYTEVAFLLLLNFFDSLSITILVLFTYNFLFSYLYTIIFVFFSDYFVQEIQEFAPVLTNLLWAIMMIIYVCCAYFMSDWRNHLSKFTAIPILVLTLLFQCYMNKVKPNYLQQEQTEITSQENSSILSDLFKRIAEIKNDSQQRKNLIAFVVFNTCGFVSYFGVFIALNRLKGNVYINSSVSILFELQGGIVSAILVRYFPIKKILFSIFSVMTIAYLSSFIFISLGKEDPDSVLSIIISLSPIFAAKAAHEMLFLIFVMYLPKIVQPQYHQFAFASANIVGVIVINFLPFNQYLMEFLGLNQFIGYGLFMLLALIELKEIVELEQGDEKKLHSNDNPQEDIPLNDIELPLIDSSQSKENQ